MLSGIKKYVLAAGLVGVAVVHVCQGDFQAAWHNLIAAGIAAGMPDPSPASSATTKPGIRLLP